MRRRSRSGSALVATARGASVAWLLGVALQAQVAQPPDPERPTFRAGVETVVVSVTVRDRSNHLVTTLERGDFRVLVDGRPVNIDVFSHERRPLMLGILLSTGQSSRLTTMRDVGRALVDAIEPGEHAAIGTYAHELAISPFATADRAILTRVLDEEVWPGIGGNLVNDAVAAMIRAMPKDRGKPVVVVAGSDFAQHCGYRPCLGEGTAETQATREGVVVYGVVSRTKDPPTQVGAFPVSRMSERTGGGYIFVRERDDLPTLMKQVAEELRHEYLLGFRPPVADDGEHTVRVDVAKPEYRAMVRVTQKARRK
jgi:Ca-activated chloride channel family protein